MAIFHPTLKSLKQKLNIQAVNTGKIFSDQYGVEYDDMEQLHPLVGADGYIHLRSGTEFAMTHYRGQNEDFGVCNTTLDRCKTKEEQFLNICKTIAFEELLQTHPFVKYLYTLPPIGKNYLSINLTGMAQHYGLHTNYLDITNNFDVACFFATCKYENGKYIPYTDTSKLGVLYQVHEHLIPPFNKNNEQIEIEYLGWQPLPRPEQQRASVLKMKKDTNLDDISSIKKYYFKHSISQSQRIWKQFDEGKILFPNDSASELANECLKLNSFTQQQINKAFDRFYSWSNDSLMNKEQILDKLNIEIVENHNLNWNNLVEVKKEYWEERFNQTMSKVKFRFVCDHFELD